MNLAIWLHKNLAVVRNVLKENEVKMKTGSAFQFARLARISSALTVVCAAVALSGCLQTRSGVQETEEKQIIRKQVANLQQTTADVNQRFSDIEEDQRKADGKVEALDARLTQIKDRAEKNDFALEGKLKEQDSKFTAFREELEKMKAELAETRTALSAAQGALQAIASGGAVSGGAAGASTAKSADPFETGEAKFEAKAYRDAIFAYEDYRKKNPKGKHVVAATYKIGVCFQELGMTDDAKPFYEEVIAKAPKSREADRARARLKALAKKK